MFTDKVVLIWDLNGADLEVVSQARRLRTYCGNGVVTRDPDLEPHQPRRAR